MAAVAVERTRVVLRFVFFSALTVLFSAVAAAVLAASLMTPAIAAGSLSARAAPVAGVGAFAEAGVTIEVDTEVKPLLAVAGVAAVRVVETGAALAATDGAAPAVAAATTGGA